MLHLKKATWSPLGLGMVALHFIVGMIGRVTRQRKRQSISEESVNLMVFLS